MTLNISGTKHVSMRMFYHLIIACIFITICQFEGALGIHRIAIPQHPKYISRHYRDTSRDILNDNTDDETNLLRKKVDVETSLLESLLAYVAEQQRHNSIELPDECEDPKLEALVRSKVKRALAEEDYKTLYFNRVREDLAKTLGEKKLGAISDISEHLKKNFKDEARRRGKIVKRELLNENYYKTLYIQKIADDIKSDLTKTNTKNIPVSKLNEIVKRELEDNFKSQYIAKVTNIVKGQLEQDLKQVAKRDARWNEVNSEWIRKEIELLYKLEAYQARDKRQATTRNDLPADFKTLYIQRIADDVKREVVERNMTNVSVNKLNDIVKRELEDNLKSDYVAKLTAFLKGQLEDTLRNITPDISRHRREALYVNPDFRDFLLRTERDLGSATVDGNPSSDTIGDYIEKMLEAFLAGQFAIRVDDSKTDALNGPKKNVDENVNDDKSDVSSGDRTEIGELKSGSANPYLPAIRYHDGKEKTHHLDVNNKESHESEEKQRGHDKDRGVVIDGVPENEYFNIEPFDKEAVNSTFTEDEEEAKDNPPYMLNYYKRDHTKEHVSTDKCDNAPRKPSCAPAKDGCPKRPAAPPKKGKYCKVKVTEGGAPGAHHKPGGEGCSSTSAENRTTQGCTSKPKCATTPTSTTTHRPGGKKCGNKAASPKTKPKCQGKAGNASEPVVTGDFVRFEIFNVNIPTRMLNASTSEGGTKCGRRSSDGAPIAKHGVSLAKGNHHAAEKIPLKVNFKGEKTADKKTWYRRHSVKAKPGRLMVLDGVREDDENVRDGQAHLVAKEDDVDSGERSEKSVPRREFSAKKISSDQESEDDNQPMVPGRRKLLSWNEEDEDNWPAVDRENFLMQDLDVDWAKALAPHLSIRKRDLSTDPLNGYPTGGDDAVEEEDSGRTRVKRNADGFGDDDNVRRNCFDDEVEVARFRTENDQEELAGQNFDQRSKDREFKVGMERNDEEGFHRRQTEGKNLLAEEIHNDGYSNWQAPENFDGEIQRGAQEFPGKAPSDGDPGSFESDKFRAREKRNSDGSLCVLLKANIKEDDHGDNETCLTINGKADYKLAVKNEGVEGVGNEATNLTMNGAANLNQEFHMPKQCPGEAMREISAELVDKLNSLGSCGGAERLMAPQAVKSDGDGGRRVGRVATNELKRVGAGLEKSEGKGSAMHAVVSSSDANGSRRVGRVANGDVNGNARSMQKVVVDGGGGRVPSGPDNPVAGPKIAAVATKQTGNIDGNVGARPDQLVDAVAEESPRAKAAKLAEETANVALTNDRKDFSQAFAEGPKVAVNAKAEVIKDTAKNDVKTEGKMSRRSNGDLYQIGLGKLLMAARHNKVSARGVSMANASDDIVKLIAKVESELSKKDFQKLPEPLKMNDLGSGAPKGNAGDRKAAKSGGRNSAEKKPAKRSVTQESKPLAEVVTSVGKSRLRDLMDSFGGGNHHDDEIGKRDLMADLYESFGPVDAEAEEFHVKKELGPNALAYSDVSEPDEGKIEKRSVGDRYGGQNSHAGNRGMSPRQRRWHPGYQTERDFYDDLDEVHDVDGDHVSRVQELLTARRARGRPDWTSLGLDVAGYPRDKRMAHWSATMEDFRHMLRDIVQSNHDDQVAGFDGHGHYFNPVHFLRPVPDRRKRNYHEFSRRQLQPEEEDEMIDAEGQACGGRRPECDGQEGPPRPRPEKISTDEPDDPGDCDEATEEGSEASVGTSRPQTLVIFIGLVLVGGSSVWL